LRSVHLPKKNCTILVLTMSKERTRTKPNLADTSPAHLAAISAGNDHFRAWEYNVIDAYKDKTVEEIRQHLRETAFPYAVCIESWAYDFNISTCIRNANGFNAKEVFYIGNKRFDKRGCKGVHNYTDVKWLPTIDDFIHLKERYKIVGIDNVPGSVPMPSYKWEPNSLMVFGSESVGLTPAMQAMCSDIVNIPMMGSVRSFNCGCASAMAMYDYTSKFTGARKQ